MNCGDLFRELAEHCDITAASPDQAGGEFAAACRRVDQDPRERQRIADIANLIDTEDAIYTQALSALDRGQQDTALPLLEQAAEAGIGEAAWLLAGRLEGQGRTQESLTWYRRAAADGDPRAARHLFHPVGRRAHVDSYRPASVVLGETERPVRLRPRALHGSGWMTGIVIPATAAAAVVAVVVAAVAIATVFTQRGTPPARSAGRLAGTSPSSSPEAVARSQAVTWILHQASRSAIVSCDPQVCTDLSERGFPNLLTLGPQSNDPLGSNLVVATAAIRAQFHNRLASVYAPIVIAAFGSGNAKIEIREVFPEGTSEYRALARADARARKNAGAQLLTNNRFTFSPQAMAQLRSGEIDPRLPSLLAIMVQSHPLSIVDFGGRPPGAGSASLLRSVDLAATDQAAHLSGAAYLAWIHGFINAQRAQFRPTLSQVKLPTGQTVLRIGYGAPSPLR